MRAKASAGIGGGAELGLESQMQEPPGTTRNLEVSCASIICCPT